jgi:hypothetical protein
MLDHFGVSPEDTAMRVYARALEHNAKVTRMKKYFLKVDDSPTFGFEL